MNIIQIQDRLKGLPEQALVKYVEQPMGEVPIYLALGELQRRKDMKARFDASQPEKSSVAEQLVAEAKPMQMGLGAMAPQQMMPEGQGVGAPQPQQAVDPRQLAASGIAANPQSAVGGTAMMKEGGIVGYAPGGDVQYSDEFIKMLEDQAKLNQGTGGPYGGSVYPKYGETSYEQAGQMLNSEGEEVFPGDPEYLTGTKYPDADPKYKFGDIKNIETKKSIVGSTALADTYQPFREPNELTKKAKDIKDANEKAEEEIQRIEKKLFVDKVRKEKDDEQRLVTEDNKTDGEKGGKKGGDKGGDNDELAGLLSMNEIFDSYRNSPEEARAENKRLKEAYGIDTDFYESGTNDNINMSLIQAGLAIAGGTSANPLENISKGALPALESFNKEKARLSGANRLENLQDLDNYREDQDKLRAYAIDLYGKNAANKLATSTLTTENMKNAQNYSMARMKDLYGTANAGTFFNTPLGKTKYGELSKAYKIQALMEYQTGVVQPEQEVFVPYVDASGNNKQVNIFGMKWQEIEQALDGKKVGNKKFKIVE